MLDTNIYIVMRKNAILPVDSVGDSIIRYIFFVNCCNSNKTLDSIEMALHLLKDQIVGG